jgi:hypothetical protein
METVKKREKGSIFSRYMKKNYLDLLDAIGQIAHLGLNYSKDPYDLERYRRLMELAAGAYSDITGLESPEIKARLGYITAKVGVQGALFDETGRLLLEKRRDDGLWGMPAGWVETGETPADALRVSHESLAMEYHDPATIVDWHKDHGLQEEDAVRYRLDLVKFG